MYPFRLRIPRPQHQHPGGQRAAERLTLDGQLVPALARTPRTAPSPSQTSTRGTAPPGMVLPTSRQSRSWRRRGGLTRAAAIREYATNHRQHWQPLRGAGLPEPDRQPDVREPEIVLRDLPGYVAVRTTVRRQVDRPQLPHPAVKAPSSTAANRSAPRSPSPASSGTPASSSRIRGSTASTTDPAARRVPRRPIAAATPPAPCSSRSPTPARSP